MVNGTDLLQVLSESEDIAKAVSQKPTSAHVLLAMFTIENRAQLLLKDRGIDEDSLLGVMTTAPKEDDELLGELLQRTQEIAVNCGSKEADCLHLLIALTRVRCEAQKLLLKTGLELSALRNTALSYFLGGSMPRKLQVGRAAPPRVSRQNPLGAPSKSPAAVSLAPPPLAEPAPPVTTRELLRSDAPEFPKKAAEKPPAPRGGTPFALDGASFPLLTTLARNLTSAAVSHQLDPVIGRQREIEEVIDILGKRRTNNPCLVGEPGVGKTAIAEGVAQKLVTSSGSLAQKIVLELDVASLVAGTQLRGSFSEKLNALKDEVRRANGRVVVFMDEIHTLIGAGATGEGPQDAANELKSAMARGEFPCIGATTHDEFRKYIQSDPALERRFTPVVVKEPSVPETVEILKGVAPRYAEHHSVTFDKDALEAAASLGARYVSDRYLPDKAIAIIDLAGSRAHREGKTSVDAHDIARVIAKLAGIGEDRLLMHDTARLMRLEEDLAERVIGHREAIAALSRVIRRNYAGFASRRPMGSFLFLGPTGVGKTELARALAETLFGSPDAMIRIDMSELSEAHGISKLIGAPPGYVGYGDGGQLTEPVRRRPSSVVVLDEIDKASRDVLLLLLQVLEEGRLTDGKGRHIDFSNTIVVLTSNLGAEVFGRAGRTVGFGTDSAPRAPMALEAAQQALPPELWNRIDERLIFEPLGQTEIAKIATLLLFKSSERLSIEKGIAYFADDEVVQHLLREGGFDPKLGARPMRQTVQRLVEGPLAERILVGDFASGDQVRVALEGESLTFNRASRPT